VEGFNYLTFFFFLICSGCYKITTTGFSELVENCHSLETLRCGYTLILNLFKVLNVGFGQFCKTEFCCGAFDDLCCFRMH
jgi:hypothetical protein